MTEPLGIFLSACSLTMKEKIIYIVYIILCLLLGLSIKISVAEAGVMDWFKTKEVIAQVTEPVIVYKLGDTIPEVEIDRLIAKYATSTKAYQMKRTLYCESHYRNIKSMLDEESYGIAQIHLPSHPNITKEQALNPEFSIQWMANNWTTKWYGYNRLLDACN